MEDKMSKEHLKPTMLAALGKSLGVVTTAAQNAGINPKTHYEWLKLDKEYKADVEAVNNTALDFVESKLFKLIEGMKVPDTKVHVHLDKEGKAVVTKVPIEKHYTPDTAATIFYLKTRGKERGYIERTEISKVKKIKVTRTSGGA